MAFSQALIVHSGYMHKYRAHTIGIFTPAWQLRYLVLSGTVVHVYKSERDAAFAPRAMIDVEGCSLELEGQKRGRFHTLRIVDAAGNLRLRISSESRAAFNSWKTALQRRGCTLARSGLPHTTPHASMRRTPSSHSLSRYSDSSNASEVSGPLPMVPRTALTWRVQSAAHLRSAGSEASLGSDTSAASVPTSAQDLMPGAGATETSSQGGSPRYDDATTGAPNGGADRKAARLRQPATAAAAAAAAPAAAAGAAKPVRPLMAPSEPLHVSARYSFLSSERIRHQQHAGLINLGMVIILAANSRLILENLLKYGLRANPVKWLQGALASSSSNNRPTLLCFPLLVGVAVLALAVEACAALALRAEDNAQRAASKKEQRRVQAARARTAWMTELTTTALQVLVCGVLPLAIPIRIVFSTAPSPLVSFPLMMCALTIWMKLISYAQCNADYREARRHGEIRAGEKGSQLQQKPYSSAGFCTTMFVPRIAYPGNLSLGNMLYFLAAPTLTYQASYPQTDSIRVRWLMRRCLETVLYSGLLLFIVDQYVEPAILNSLQPLRDSNLVKVVERVLKLSLPCLYVWLTMFYLFFHLWLNIVAELTYFADREFYKDWWNATTIGEYWRLWNQPVHRWMMRSVFTPLMRRGAGRLVSACGAFFVSAVMHELAVGVPLRMVRYWAFAGMMFQLPMVILTEMLKVRLKNDRLGNVIFWVSFCIVGQPMCALLYYHDYLLEHAPDSLIPHPQV